MNIEIEEIRQLLQARKIEEALQLLAARFKSTENQKDVDLLISRFNEGKRKETLGISGREDTTIAENKLIHDILGFIESPETFKQVRNYKRYQANEALEFMKNCGDN